VFGHHDRPQTRAISSSLPRIFALVMLGALLVPAAWGLDTKTLKPTGYVNDFAHKLDPASAQALEVYCGNLERSTGVQMAIVLVDSIDDEPVEDVANRLYREWGIGKKGQNEGMLILLAMKERKTRAEVGYGLEPIITDADAGSVLRTVQPIFRQGNYGGGLLAAVQQFGDRIAQAKGVTIEGTVPVQRMPTRQRGGGIPFPLLLLGIFVLLFIMSRGGGGGMGGLLTGMLLGNMMGGGRRGGDWGGGGFGGGGGGGGFGGFGGGDSGGGGASGGW
jgi:uncharacterized protein